MTGTERGDSEAEAVERCRDYLMPQRRRFTVRDGTNPRRMTVVRTGAGRLTTAHGGFWCFSYRVSDTWRNYVALVHTSAETEGMPQISSEPVHLRIDSACVTGQVFGDLSCDCRAQLNAALERLAAVSQGVLVHIPRHEGRGLGLDHKLAMLALQATTTFDTCEAARVLHAGGQEDVRTYVGVVGVLRHLGVPQATEVVLSSNNPAKAQVLKDNGFGVRMDPLVIPATDMTARHLRAKRDRLGHVLPGDL